MQQRSFWFRERDVIRWAPLDEISRAESAQGIHPNENFAIRGSPHAIYGPRRVACNAGQYQRVSKRSPRKWIAGSFGTGLLLGKGLARYQ